MRLCDLKVGMDVFDPWSDLTGVVEKVMKTRAYIFFFDTCDFMKYDGPHCQFLREKRIMVPTDDERIVIEELACGNFEAREEATRIHRKYLGNDDYHVTDYYAFMSEIDNVVPCYILKAQARKALGGPGLGDL
jgi:hypothetical protein